MRLSFSCEYTGAKPAEPFINTAIFTMADGSDLVLDRGTTEYTMRDDGTMSMYWRQVYRWDGKDEHYDIDPADMAGAVLKELEVEDDAPDGYGVTCVGWLAE